MKDTNIWNHAAYAGLALGSVSTAYMFLTQFLGTSGLNPFISTALTFILWGAKFGGCIYIMITFMKKAASETPEADASTTFKFGMVASFLSALVYAAATFANIAYISADLMAEQYAKILDIYKSMMDSNSMSMIDDMMGRLPQISFFSNLIYCFIYGTLLSSILSRTIPGNNPFADGKLNEK